MDELETRPGRRLRAYLRRRLTLAAVALLWEQVWPAAWPALFIAGAFAALALSDFLPLLPGWAHVLVLAGFAAGFAAALVRGAKRLHLPAKREAERRVERESHLANRPLEALDDRPAVADLSEGQRELWRAHRARMAAALEHLKVGLPHAGLAKRDPYGLRVVVVLALLLAFLDARGDSWRRVLRAVTPSFPAVAAAEASLDAWVTPPPYTGLPTVVLAKTEAGLLDPAAAAEVTVPTGSTFFAQVRGGRARPNLKLEESIQPFAPISDESFEIRAPLEKTGDVAVTQGGRTLADWKIHVAIDAPPAIAMKEEPAKSERGALRLSYKVSDDFGVAAATGTVTRAKAPTGGAPTDSAQTGGAPTDRAQTGDAQTDEPPIEFALPLPAGRVTEGESVSYTDLTAHKWAGTPVTLVLTARDGAGQTGSSEPITFLLPEREFKNEVAREIVALRKQLTIDPAARRPVAQSLLTIMERPDRFNDDIVVFLALRSAIGRLMLDREAKAVGEAQDLMWNTALRIEDHGASLAARDMREIQKELREALTRGAESKEIRELMDRLEEAMNRYLESLAQTPQGQPPEGALAPDSGDQTYRPEDLRDMLDRARELAETGDREAAQQMLSQLEDILENLRAPQPVDPEAQRAAKEAIDSLQNLIDRQQQLLDRSFQEAVQPEATPPQGKPGGKPEAGKAGKAGQAAEDQEALRGDLGDTMLKFGELLGEIPGEMGRAEQSMREATQALKSGKPNEAVAPQSKALDQLQQAMKNLRQEMARRQQQQGQGGPGLPRPGQGRDPLGRPLDENGQGTRTGNVRIPDQMELRRAREILDELRERSGDLGRPEVERNYIDRLLPRY